MSPHSRWSGLALAVPFAFAACSDQHEDDGCPEDGIHDPIAYASLPLVPARPGELTFAVLDVGQGDAAVVVSPSGCAALFDGGPTGSGATIKANLASLGVTHLDFAVASHYHADHIGALDEVEQGTSGVPIAVVYDRGGNYQTLSYDQYAAQFAGRRVTMSVGTTFSLCGEVDFAVRAVNANGVSTTNENALSFVVEMSYGAFDALVGGDLTGASPDVESSIAATVGEIEVYKVHHHGSSTSTNSAMLGVLQPTVGLISLGANNSYGHPAPDTLSRLASVNTQVWQTEETTSGAKLGPVVITSVDGASYTVTQGAVSATHSSKGVVLDTTPPSVPGAVTATATASAVIELAWQASSDDVGVAEYIVERSLDGATFELLAETATTTWTDSGLAADTSYWYVVSAVDAAGNESEASAAAVATTPAIVDTTPPSAPPGLAGSASPTSVSLTWGTSTDDTGVAHYRVRRDGTMLADTAETSWTDAPVEPGATYVYAVTAHDAAGNASAASLVTAEIPWPPDTTPPSAPTDLAAAATASSVSLSWSASTDDRGVVRYSVQRDGTGLADAFATSFIDGTVAPGMTYAYAVVAFDAAGNASPPSLSAGVTTPCSVTLTSRSWNASRKELTVKATCTSETTIQILADGVFLGDMDSGSKGYTFKARLAARPTCVTITAACGGTATSCF